MRQPSVCRSDFCPTGQMTVARLKTTKLSGPPAQLGQRWHAAKNHIGVPDTPQRVITTAADDHVPSVAAPDPIVTATGENQIITAMNANRVVTGAGLNKVIPDPRFDLIVAAQDQDAMMSVSGKNRIVTLSRKDLAVSVTDSDPIVTAATVNAFGETTAGGNHIVAFAGFDLHMPLQHMHWVQRIVAIDRLRRV